MLSKEKLTLLLLALLMVASLSSACGLYFVLKQERAKGLTLLEELADIKERQKATETKLEESGKLISELELKLQDAKTQIDTLTQELDQEKSSKQAALEQIGQLRLDLQQQNTMKSNLEKQLTQAQDDIDKMQVQLKELEAKKNDLETKIKDLETQVQQVELGKIVVGQEAQTAPQRPAPETEKSLSKTTVVPLEGKVSVINKDYNFVVIDRGSKESIKVGDVFLVYHNNAYVGDVKVEKVHDSMAAAGFVSLDIKDKISEGDRVVLKTQ